MKKYPSSILKSNVKEVKIEFIRKKIKTNTTIYFHHGPYMLSNGVASGLTGQGADE